MSSAQHGRSAGSTEPRCPQQLGSLLAACALPSLASAGPGIDRGDGFHWRRVADVESVDTITARVSPGTLHMLQVIHGEGGALAARGLAVLQHNTVTGAYVCHIYVLSLGDRETLAHELRHCHGWAHE